MPEGLLFTFMNIAIIITVTAIISFLLGLNKHERTFILNKVKMVRG